MTEILYNNITIEGNIGAGKTTLASALSEKIDGRLILESFENNPFLELFYSQKDRYAFQVEMFFLAERYHQLSRHLLGDIFQRHTVSDYLFSKSAIFSAVNLSGSEHELFLNLYRIMDRFMPRPDILVYLHLPIDQITTRIKERGRPFEQSISASYLQSIENSYLNYLKEEQRFPVVIVEENQTNGGDVSTSLRRILDVVSREWPNGISHFSDGAKK